MTSSDNLTSLEPWLFRPPFPADPWFSDAFARDTDAALARAFTNSISTPVGFHPSSDEDALFDVLNAVVSSPGPNPDTPQGAGQTQSITGSVSGTGSGSDLETVSKKSGKRGATTPASGRIGKRKSRPSKKSPTTFITADAENFRQMVQQVTGGVQFPAAAARDPSILKPEAQRFGGVGGRFQGCLPTLDTSSAFLMDRHQQAVDYGGSVPEEAASAGGADCGGGGTGDVDFGSFSCFPTLDSWEVV